jgi:hypothetical protein
MEDPMNKEPQLQEIVTPTTDKVQEIKEKMTNVVREAILHRQRVLQQAREREAARKEMLERRRVKRAAR